MRKPDAPLDEEHRQRPEESFLQRFHRRKLEARGLVPASEAAVEGGSESDIAGDGAAVSEPRPEPTDADMPPLESLNEESDYSGFLSAKVSESLRRAALRKLFHSSTFNIVDELDDYAEDFTTFEALGDLVTAEMRHRLDVEQRREADRVQQGTAEQAPAVSDETAEATEHSVTEADTTEMSESTVADAGSAAAGSSVSPTAETDIHAERSVDT